MRLSDIHRYKIKEMESQGYVWLSHLTPRAQMRFRDRTRRGYSQFTKVNGLTFLTKEVADYLEATSKPAKEARVKVSEKNKDLEERLASASDMLAVLRHHLILTGDTIVVEGLDVPSCDFRKVKSFIEKGD